jgi:hypothetical protein
MFKYVVLFQLVILKSWGKPRSTEEIQSRWLKSGGSLRFMQQDTSFPAPSNYLRVSISVIPW